MEFNTEDFIVEIEKRPSIWDPSHEDYVNRKIRKKAWEEIFHKFVPNFAEKSLAEKNVSALNIQRRWKSLRDSYSRELLKLKKLKSGLASARKKQYVFFEQLRFLERVKKPTTGQGSETKRAEEVNEVEEYENGESILRPKKRKRQNTKEFRTDEEVIDSTTAKCNSRDENNDAANDEDRLFMLSLVPDLKKLPDFLKLETKGELLNIIKRARQQCFPSRLSNLLSQSAPSQNEDGILLNCVKIGNR